MSHSHSAPSLAATARRLRSVVVVPVTATVLLLTGCQSWTGHEPGATRQAAHYQLLAGIFGATPGSEESHPVLLALKRAKVDFILGDHAARRTQLWCSNSDWEKAHRVIDQLPGKERALVDYVDSHITR